ncbi:MAG TPA: flagellar export protein FliJ [Gammaproteobacteria bacterium]|jgi:flagellar export protein FliJ|nr:flagellar export protein FliJ [Gammaproteobacteria bacterium]
MNRASRLEPIAEYAGKLEDEAARRLAASASAIQAKEREVEQLRSYLAEYRRRDEQAPPSADPLRWQNGRAFLARLCAAVAAQETELQKAVERYRLEAERWRESYRRSKSLDQLIERGEQEQRRERQRRDQAELDELALRRSLADQ